MDDVHAAEQCYKEGFRGHQTAISSTLDGLQVVRVKVALTGIGTFGSWTVTDTASWSEQYSTFLTATILGRQPLISGLISCPLFVKLLPVQVIDSMPVPVRSIVPLPSA